MADTRFSVKIPRVLIESIEEYIQHGDGYDVVPSKRMTELYPDVPFLDIRPAMLMRLLVSMYGEQYTPEADYLINDLISYETRHKNLRSVTIRTSNQRILDNRSTFVIQLIRAMVWQGIPIEGYFDGQQIIQ